MTLADFVRDLLDVADRVDCPHGNPYATCDDGNNHPILCLECFKKMLRETLSRLDEYDKRL